MRLSKAQSVNWHPNFVDQAALPDIKVIRTNFLLNLIAVGVVLGFGFFIIQKELAYREVSSEIARQTEVIAQRESANQKALSTSRQFQTVAQKFVEIGTFKEGPIAPEELLLKIASLRPLDLILSDLSYEEIEVEVAGTGKNKKNKTRRMNYTIELSGEARSLEVLNQFKSALRDENFLGDEGYSAELTESVQARDRVSGVFPFSIEMNISKASSGKASNG